MSKKSVGDTYLYSAKEMSFSQGFPEFPDLLTTKRLHSALPFDISKIGMASQMRILGEGMSVLAEECWFLYVCSRLVRRESLQPVANVMNQPDDEVQEED